MPIIKVASDWPRPRNCLPVCRALQQWGLLLSAVICFDSCYYTNEPLSYKLACGLHTMYDDDDIGAGISINNNNNNSNVRRHLEVNYSPSGLSIFCTR